MPRIEPTLPADCTAYITEIKASVHFEPQSNAEAVFNFFGKLANVVWLQSSNAYSDVKIAQQFAQEMGNLHKNTDSLAYELSFLGEAVIRELKVPYSIRNLEIVNMAILQTKLVHKQIALIGLAKGLKAQEPAPAPAPAPEPDPEAIVHPPVDNPGKPRTIERRASVEDIIDMMPTPTQRHLNMASNEPLVTAGKLIAQEFNNYLEADVYKMPFYNHVTFFANLIDHTRSANKVKNLVEKLPIRAVLYLFEAVTVHRDVVKEVLVDCYINTIDDGQVSADRIRDVFKRYLIKNKRDRAINGGYVELIEDIERAERKAALSTALVVAKPADAAV